MPDYEDSLGDQNTFDGSSKPEDRGPQSLGDEATLGGIGSDLESGSIEIDLEITDLSSRYTIEGDLGKGGMGQVQLALDTRLDRKVAIKRIHGKALRNAKAWQRFETGAKTLAKLNHPNIVQVHEYGRSVDGPFMILEYVSGGDLLKRCQDGPLPVEEAVDIACQLCDGISKCHASGVVHRDIKPANVLLSEEGIPKLNDFDLAKEQVEDSGMTMAGAVLGTLDFMPPEQRRDASLVDERSDIWSLAATLYQMLTGKSPKIIKFTSVPVSFHDVLGKALEDEKDDRYQTALEFKKALQDSLAGKARAVSQPVPQTGAELGAGECPECHVKNDSNRKFCSGCGESLRFSCMKCEQEIPVWENFCGECGGNQSDLLATRVGELEQIRSEAEQLRSIHQYEASIQLARQLAAIENDRLLEHKTWGDEFLRSTEELWEREKQAAQRHFEESKKHRRVYDYSAAIKAIKAIPEPLRSAEMKSHLKTVESEKAELIELMPIIKKRVFNREVDGLLELVDRAIELRGESGNLVKLQQQLTQRAERKQAERKQAERKRIRQSAEWIQAHCKTINGHRGSVSSVAFSPDGKSIVSGSDDETLKIWDAKTGIEKLVLQGHTSSVRSVAYSPDGNNIVSGSSDKTLKIWDLESGTEKLTLKEHKRLVCGVAYSPDGKSIVSGSWDNTIKIWDAKTGKVKLTLDRHRLGVRSVAYSPEGNNIASGSDDGTLKIWDGKMGKEKLILVGHAGRVCSVAYSPDGKSIVSGSVDKTIKIWDAKTGKERLTLKVHTGSALCVAFSPDGNSIVRGSWDNTIKTWDAKTGKKKLTLNRHTDCVSSVAFSPDGNSIVSGSDDKTLKIWDVSAFSSR